MATVASESDIHSTMDVARHFGVSQYVVIKAIDRLGIGRRIGRNRAVRTSDFDRIEAALIGARAISSRRADARQALA